MTIHCDISTLYSPPSWKYSSWVQSSSSSSVSEFENLISILFRDLFISKNLYTLAITEASLTRVFGTKSHSMPVLVHRRSVVHNREVLVVMAAVTSLAWRWGWQHAMWRSTWIIKLAIWGVEAGLGSAPGPVWRRYTVMDNAHLLLLLQPNTPASRATWSRFGRCRAYASRVRKFVSQKFRGIVHRCAIVPHVGCRLLLLLLVTVEI